MEITREDAINAKLVIRSFENKTIDEIFYNMCFAILAPQTTFKSNRKAIDSLKEHDFIHQELPRADLEVLVKPTRFFRQKADRLLKAKKQFGDILINVLSEKETKTKREYLVGNVCGLGMKAASHFLRNLGHKDLAIIDTHVLKFLNCDKPKNNKDYLKIEKEFEEIAYGMNLWPVELDAIVWKKYSNTPWEKFTY